MAKSHQRPFSRRQLAVIAKIAFIEAMALSLIIPTISSTGEIPTNPSIFDQISYVTSVSGNNTGIGMVTTNSWNAISNQSMIIVAAVGTSTLIHTMVSNITDTLGDKFNRVLIQQFAPGSIDGNNIEVWYGKVKISGTNSITAKWNFTDGLGTQILQANMYNGVSGTGAINSTSTTSNVATSLSLKPLKSGSWIFGAINLTNPLVCPTIGTSPNFIKRVETCQILSGAIVNEAESSDNATILRNSIQITYAPTGAATQNDYAMVELTSVDLEPLTPDFTTFCTVTNSPCSYLNFVAKVTGPNSLVNIVVGTAYCTGVTSSALTSTKAGNHLVIANGQYNGQSRNDTGAVILVQLYTSTTAPSTAFGAGLCAIGGSIVSASKITFDTSGATITAYGLNEYSASTIGTSAIGGTGSLLYSWFEITPQSVGNVNTGSTNAGSTIQYAQWGSHSVLQLGEVR